MAFWGCEVTETKAAVVEVPAGFVLNVCNATSGVSNAADTQLALGLETQQLDGNAWKGAVAHLGGRTQPLQVKLDLVFGHKVKFYVAKGSGSVNLTGYFQPGPELEEVETPKVLEAEPAKKSKKRAREEKKEVSSNDSAEVTEKKVKAVVAKEEKKSKPVDIPAKKEEKKPKQVEATPSNGDSTGTSQKKKRKKNRSKKAAEGEAK